MWCVYILLCTDHSLYTGISTNPYRRFAKHQSGQGGAYTRAHPPIRIVYTEIHPDRSSALHRELEIKSWPRSQKISRLDLRVS